jgi:hypothetical protein
MPLQHGPGSGLGGRARICHSCSQSTCVAINTSPRSLERVEGIEPAHLAGQASRLPLHHTRDMVEAEGVEPF